MLHRLIFGAILLMAASLPARGGPNLTASVEMDVDYYATEALVTFHVTFENKGDAYCGSSLWYADFWGAYPCQCDTNPMFCGTAPASDMTWVMDDPEILGPGTTWAAPDPVVLQYPYSDEPYRFMLFVDSLFFCNEGGDEEDNLVCGEFTIDPTAQAADLEIVDCTVGQDPEFPAGVLFTAVVRNVGESPSEQATDVDFFMQDNPAAQTVDQVWGEIGADFSSVAAGLEPQQEVVVSSTLSQCEPGWYYPIYTVNGFETFDEPGYDNNWCVPAPPQYECSENILKPDLLISEVAIDQEILDLQGLIRIQGKIKNQGLLPVTNQESYKLCIYEDWPQKPEDCEVPEHGVNGWILSFDNGLGAALEQDFDKISETAVEGLHDYWFRVDCDCVDPEYGEILESDEKNNEAKLEDVLIPVEGPDLIVSVLQAVVLPIEGANVIRYIVEVTNIGTEPIEADVEVDLFRDYPSVTPPDFDTVMAAIDAGEEWVQNAEYFAIPGGLQEGGGHAQAEFTDWNAAEDGNYTPWVVVDIVDAILEANEDNNAATIAGGVDYVVLPPTEGPNLTIETFSGEVEGNRITYELVVRNTGDEVAAGPFRIDLFTDRESPPNLFEKAEVNIIVDELLPDETAPWVYEWNEVEDGTYRSYALVDALNVIKETEEGDNLAGFLLLEVGAAACPEGEILQDGCLCSGEPQHTGYCCDDEWSAVPCAPLVESQPECCGDEIVTVTEGDEELVTSFGGAAAGCGCRHGARNSFPAGPALALTLLAVPVLVMRRRRA